MQDAIGIDDICPLAAIESVGWSRGYWFRPAKAVIGGPEEVDCSSRACQENRITGCCGSKSTDADALGNLLRCAPLGLRIAKS